jgi:hypothetical protein
LDRVVGFQFFHAYVFTLVAALEFVSVISAGEKREFSRNYHNNQKHPTVYFVE